MLAINHKVEVIGEFYSIWQFLQDVDAETFAATLDVRTLVTGYAGRKQGGKQLSDKCAHNQELCAHV